MDGLVQKLIVEASEKASSLLPQRVALVNPDGTPYGGGESLPGAPGASVKAIELVKDASGAITGGTATLTDNTTVEITVTVTAS